MGLNLGPWGGGGGLGLPVTLQAGEPFGKKRKNRDERLTGPSRGESWSEHARRVPGQKNPHQGVGILRVQSVGCNVHQSDSARPSDILWPCDYRKAVFRVLGPVHFPGRDVGRVSVLLSAWVGIAEFVDGCFPSLREPPP